MPPPPQNPVRKAASAAVAPSPQPSGGKDTVLERGLFALLLVLHLLPLFLFPALPTQDGPSHQGVTAILRQLDGVGGEAPTARLGQVFLRNRGALPNVFVFWLLERGFGPVSLPLAEKLLLALYVLLLPLGLRAAVTAVDGRAAHLSWLGFPFVYNFLLHMGFYNFCFSLAAFLFTLGAYWRWRRRTTPLRLLGLTLLVTWVYVCHPVTLVVTVATLGSIALWDLALERRAGPDPGQAGRRAGLAHAALRRLGPVLLAALPALALMIAFVAARAGAKVEGLPFAVRLKHLAGLYSLASLDRRSALLAAGTALLLGVLAVLALAQRRKPGSEVGGVRTTLARREEESAGGDGARGGGRMRAGDGLLAAIAVLLLAYFLAPSQMSGGGFIVHRLNLFPFLLLIVWLATVEHPRRRRLAVQTCAALLALGFLALFARSYARLGEGLAEIAAAGPAIERGKTLVFLSYAHQGVDGAGEPLAFRTQPFVHAGSAVAAARGAVDLALYEANEDYFPVIYRREANPYTHLATAPLGIETEPPRVDLDGYPRRTGVPIDYVLLWGWREERRDEPAVAAVARQLAAGFDEIERSPSGRVRLFRARPPR